MGLMRFRVDPLERLTPEMVDRAYLSGIDHITWPVRASIENGELCLQRSNSDSACLYVPWAVEGQGTFTLSSGTLSERDEPYLLPLELARGTVNQLRSQLFEWQSIGLLVGESLISKVFETTRQLSLAAVHQDDPAECAVLSEICLRSALDTSDQLAASYLEQAMLVRRRGVEKLPICLGGDLGSSLWNKRTARQLLLAFNTGNVPLCWRDIEVEEGRFDWTIPDTQIQWCRQNGLTVSAGPLLLLDARAWPDWLTLWEDDFDSLQEFAAQFLRTAVERYRGKVDYWQCVGRLNTAEMLSFGEEEKLRLTALAIQIVNQLDPDKPVLIHFDQPWAEYMSRRNIDFPPLHFADALVRSGLAISGLGLEINLGHHPGGTQHRHLLEFSHQLDLWNYFGLPLWLTLSVPSSDEEDRHARRKDSVLPHLWTPESQQAWVSRYVPMMLAKPFVQGILWNQLFDSEQHDFPNAGLFDQELHAKPAFKTLAALRKTFLR